MPPPIPRQDETVPPPDDPASSPFVTRPEFSSFAAETRRRLEVVEAAQRLGDEALSNKLHEVSDAVNTIASETATQTKTLEQQRTALERFATREELSQLATQEQLGALRTDIEKRDAAQDERSGKQEKAIARLTRKVATRWQAYAQIAAGLLAVAAAIAGAVAR